MGWGEEIVKSLGTKKKKTFKSISDSVLVLNVISCKCANKTAINLWETTGHSTRTQIRKSVYWNPQIHTSAWEWLCPSLTKSTLDPKSKVKWFTTLAPHLRSLQRQYALSCTKTSVLFQGRSNAIVHWHHDSGHQWCTAFACPKQQAKMTN